MNAFSTISRVFLFCIGVTFLTLPIGWFPSFYDVRYIGVAAIAGILIIQFIPNFFRVPEHTLGAKQKNGAVDAFRFLLAFGIMSNLIGELGLYELYKYGFEFDKIIHFITPLVAVVMLPEIVHDRFGIRRRYSLPILFLLVIAAGVLWEFYEFTLDLYFGTHLYGVYGLNVSTDTKFDLLADLLGSIAGVFFLIYRHYSRRRGEWIF